MKIYRLDVFYPIYIAYLIVGYAVFSAVSEHFGLGDNSSLILAFRFSVLLLAFSFVFFGCYRNLAIKKLVINIYFIFLLFWLFYFFRLFLYVIDSNEGISDENFKKYVLYPLLIIIFPSIPLMCKLDSKKVAYFFVCGFWLLLASCLTSFYIGTSNFLAGIGIESGRIALTKLSPIQLGKYAAILMLFSLALMRAKSYVSVNKLICCFAITLSIGLVFFAGSRTAFVAIMLVLFIEFVIRDLSARNLLIIAVMMILAMMLFYLVNMFNIKLLGFERFLSVEGYFTESTSIRLDLYHGAYEQFLDSPLWGDYYLERQHSYSPHNLFLEVLMSTGLIGMALFILFVGSSLLWFLKTYVALPEEDKIFARYLFYIFVILAISSVFSAGITTAFEFWHVILMLGAFTYANRYSYHKLQ